MDLKTADMTLASDMAPGEEEGGTIWNVGDMMAAPHNAAPWQ